MDALILAGGEAPPELLERTQDGDRALIDLEGRALLSYVYDALRATPGIERIVVASRPTTLRELERVAPGALPANAADSMMDTVIAGLQTLNAPDVLISTCDIPLVSAATYAELIEKTRSRNLEACYPIVKREVCEAQFPEGKRTYGHVKEGAFTAGNAVIVQSHAIEPLMDFFKAAYSARKNPIAMSRLLGLGFLFKAATKQLRVSEAEARMSKLLGCDAGAIEMQDASIAFDVDKIEHYTVAQQALRKLSARSHPQP
jgi:molybdopterin-guanine dinucleotide biosynthesis protein A